MNSDDGRGRRPEAGALDLNRECYAKVLPKAGVDRVAAVWFEGSG